MWLRMVHGSECIESQFSWQEVLDIWKNFLPPIRPSITDQKAYEVLIKRIEPRQQSCVLLLGVTPELRKLANKHHFRVVAVDLHTVMIKAMDHLMNDLQHTTCNEAIIKGYWLALPFRRGTFDLVMNDCSLNSLTKVESQSLLEEMKWLLKEGGYVFMRVMTCSNEWRGQSILDIIKKQRRRHQENNKEFFENSYLQILCSIEAYDPINSRSSINDARREWRRLYNNNEISRREFEVFENVLGKGEYSPTILQRSELEELLSQNFRVICKENGQSGSMKYCPIYCLKPRKPRGGFSCAKP